MVSCPVPSITQTAASVSHFVDHQNLHFRGNVLCEEQQCNYTFSDLTDVLSKTNSQAKGVSRFQVTGPSPLNIFSTECTLC